MKKNIRHAQRPSNGSECGESGKDNRKNGSNEKNGDKTDNTPVQRPSNSSEFAACPLRLSRPLYLPHWLRPYPPPMRDDSVQRLSNSSECGRAGKAMGRMGVMRRMGIK